MQTVWWFVVMLLLFNSNDIHGTRMEIWNSVELKLYTHAAGWRLICSAPTVSWTEITLLEMIVCILFISFIFIPYNFDFFLSVPVKLIYTRTKQPSVSPANAAKYVQPRCKPNSYKLKKNETFWQLNIFSKQFAAKKKEPGMAVSEINPLAGQPKSLNSS